DSPMLPDLSYTLGHRRNHHPHRFTLVARSIPELIQELDAFAIKEDSVKVRTSFTPRPENAPRVAFVMCGQGPPWWAMGRGRTRPSRGGVAIASDRNCPACHLRDAGRISGALEIVGRASRRGGGSQRERNRRGLCRRFVFAGTRGAHYRTASAFHGRLRAR